MARLSSRPLFPSLGLLSGRSRPSLWAVTLDTKQPESRVAVLSPPRLSRPPLQGPAANSHTYHRPKMTCRQTVGPERGGDGLALRPEGAESPPSACRNCS